MIEAQPEHAPNCQETVHSPLYLDLLQKYTALRNEQRDGAGYCAICGRISAHAHELDGRVTGSDGDTLHD